MRVGVDLGGTKTEAIVLDSGVEVFRERVATHSSSYQDVFLGITELLASISKEFPDFSIQSIGLAMPGVITEEGLVKNSNTVVLNGKPFVEDLQRLTGVKVQSLNDANCFALSEAIDGAGEYSDTIFGVILGTGVGGGIVIGDKPLVGANSIAGEWGHNPLPSSAPRLSDNDRPCYCGRANCVETFLCGNGFVKTYQEMTGDVSTTLSAKLIIQQLGQEPLNELLSLYADQLAASLAVVINILDPGCIVLGGGLSNIKQLALLVEQKLPRYVFSSKVKTRVFKNHYGDSSGVRGAAWLNEYK